MRKTIITPKELPILALFAALTAIFSQISIPLPFSPIPINLALLSVFIAGGLLGGVKGSISQFVYVILGAIGLPVFANFSGGLSVLVGPTGGYIFGYILCSIIIGGLLKKFGRSLLSISLSLILGLIGCYTLGTLWFMFITGNTLYPSLILCVFPFIIGDVFKIILGVFLIKRLEGSIKI